MQETRLDLCNIVLHHRIKAFRKGFYLYAAMRHGPDVKFSDSSNWQLSMNRPAGGPSAGLYRFAASEPISAMGGTLAS